MGLDFTHCNAHWSYSGFNTFRTKLAKEIGMDLASMEGFGGKTPWTDFEDPILPLLDHSDCDGVLTPDECALVYLRLLELVENWDKDDWHRTEAIELAQGMKNAYEFNEDLVFC